MFRIYCQFKPNIKRAAGGDGMGPRQGRGAWVVDKCYSLPPGEYEPVVRFIQGVCVLATKPRQRGSRCNPRKLLAEYQAARHA